jgi:hypothetical protein
LSNYVQSTNFATKDALSSGDPLKIVKGTEINTEFNNIATAVATKADSNNIATTGEAQAGTDNAKFVTPLRMREGFNAAGTAPIYACRAWVNFDGTTPDPSTIRGSGNVSSIIKDETGVFRPQFTTALPDVNFAAVAVASGTGGAAFRIVTVSQYTTGEVVVRSANVPAAASVFPQPEDADSICLAIFR